MRSRTALRGSFNAFIFLKKECTWKTSNTATMKAAAAVRKPPMIQFDRGSRRLWLSMEGVVEANSIPGPLYIVIRSAPATDTRVPRHLARLLLTFKSSFSILIIIHLLHLHIHNFTAELLLYHLLMA